MKKKSSDATFMGILVTTPIAENIDVRSRSAEPKRKTRISNLREMIREAIMDIMANNLTYRSIVDSASYTGANIIPKMRKAAATVFKIVLYFHKRVGKKLVTRSRTITTTIPNIMPMPA